MFVTLIYLKKNSTFLSLKIIVDTNYVTNETSNHRFLKSPMFQSISENSIEQSIACYSSRPTVSQLKGVSHTMLNWFENRQPQRTQISTVTNAPFIQDSNRMAFSVDQRQKFSELILSISAVFKAIFKLFGSQGCSDEKDSLDFSSIFAVQFCFRCKISFHEKPSKLNLTVVRFC